MLVMPAILLRMPRSVNAYAVLAHFGLGLLASPGSWSAPASTSLTMLLVMQSSGGIVWDVVLALHAEAAQVASRRPVQLLSA